ncbi:unnamed protein product [Gordionus sp. m RMFG-2023]
MVKHLVTKIVRKYSKFRHAKITKRYKYYLNLVYSKKWNKIFSYGRDNKNVRNITTYKNKVINEENIQKLSNFICSDCRIQFRHLGNLMCHQKHYCNKNINKKKLSPELRTDNVVSKSYQANIESSLNDSYEVKSIDSFSNLKDGNEPFKFIKRKFAQPISNIINLNPFFTHTLHIPHFKYLRPSTISSYPISTFAPLYQNCSSNYLYQYYHPHKLWSLQDYLNLEDNFLKSKKLNMQNDNIPWLVQKPKESTIKTQVLHQEKKINLYRCLRCFLTFKVKANLNAHAKYYCKKEPNVLLQKNKIAQLLNCSYLNSSISQMNVTKPKLKFRSRDSNEDIDNSHKSKFDPSQTTRHDFSHQDASTYCKTCDIKFIKESSFTAHKLYYCNKNKIEENLCATIFNNTKTISTDTKNSKNTKLGNNKQKPMGRKSIGKTSTSKKQLH